MTSWGIVANITVDDFDPLIGYSNYADWYTPDPSANPTWYNASRDVTNSPWHEGEPALPANLADMAVVNADLSATYHTTTVPGAKATFNFTGSSFYIYGAAGPSADNANYTLVIDRTGAQPFNQTLTARNRTSNERTLLFGTESLRWDWHNVEIINAGSGLTLDLIVVGGIVGAEG